MAVTVSSPVMQLKQVDWQDTNRGLEAIARITKTLKLDGVYGPLYSLFEVDDKYKVAVEVTAGNRSVASIFKGYLQP